ncbi:MAG TPA: hypothetical protein VK540_29910 [Polyangiaceae bacterium]|jgi:hypothetical protein|nr:hypothetical protein [Polyangiaceae bacterium]
MESFRAAVDRLSKIFVTDLLAAVRAAGVEQLARQQKKEARPKPTRILRPSPAAADAARAVVVRQFDIPVGQPRRPRRRADGTAPVRKAAPPPPPQLQVVKFEVVPHPERKNRRIVMTRLDTA